MILRWIFLLIGYLFVHIHADLNPNPRLVLTVKEHPANEIIPQNLSDLPSEKILIRVPRSDRFVQQSAEHLRQRRALADADEIWGMAKKVAITVFVLIAVCSVCCIVTTVYLFIRCCCGGNDQRKRAQGFTATPQPIIIHTNSPQYHPQYYQQQAPAPAPVPVSAQTWRLENHPMLPQPSAPPGPIDDSYMDRPPPYEKICGN